ncbi:MAG: histidine kinase [Ferruginibacter sp.]
MHTYQTPIYNAVLIAAGFIGVIIIYFIITVLRQQKKYRQYHNERVTAEIAQLERERQRIASDLHDDLGPVLFATRMKLGALKNEDESEQALLAEAKTNIDIITNKLRDITNGLIPNSLLSKGLVPAIEEFLQTVSLSSDIELSFNVQNLPRFGETETIYIYRILQEIIYNTVKHAEAKNFTIELYCQKDNFIISTADDGKGFNFKQTMGTANGQGLKNIISRAEVLHGEVQVSSLRDKGTSFFIVIPF